MADLILSLSLITAFLGRFVSSGGPPYLGRFTSLFLF